jgi:hypothetical protein
MDGARIVLRFRTFHSLATTLWYPDSQLVLVHEKNIDFWVIEKILWSRFVM